MVREARAPHSVVLAHEHLRPDTNVRLSTDRAFGLSLSVFLAMIGLLPWLWSRSIRWPFLIAASIAGVAAALCPVLLGPLHRLAWRLAVMLHAVVAPVLMAVLFYGLVTPVAAILRFTGSRSVGLRLDKASNESSYWIPRESERFSNSMRAPF